MVPMNEKKTKHGTCTIYIYCSLCISFNVFCTVCLWGQMCLSTTTAGNVCLFVSVYLIIKTAGFVYLLDPFCIWSTAFESPPFLYYCLCPVLDMSWVFFFLFLLFLVNLKFHLKLNREQTEKCFLEEEIQVFWCGFHFLQRTSRKERCGETVKFLFLSLLFLSRFRLSLERVWFECLISGWGWGSCRCLRPLRRGRTRQSGTGRCWTWMQMGRWWRWRGKDKRCGQERSSRKWQERGKKKLERGRKWWVRGSWRRAKWLRPGQPSLPPLLFFLLSCPSAAGVFLCASSSHHCGQTCGRRSRRRTVSLRCECGYELSGGRCGWSYAYRCDTEKVSGRCGCECGASVHPSGKSADRMSRRGKHMAAHEEASCLVGWGTCACGWV